MLYADSGGVFLAAGWHFFSVSGAFAVGQYPCMSTACNYAAVKRIPIGRPPYRYRAGRSALPNCISDWWVLIHRFGDPPIIAIPCRPLSTPHSLSEVRFRLPGCYTRVLQAWIWPASVLCNSNRCDACRLTWLQKWSPNTRMQLVEEVASKPPSICSCGPFLAPSSLCLGWHRRCITARQMRLLE
jgi:hypothetical protein